MTILKTKENFYYDTNIDIPKGNESCKKKIISNTNIEVGYKWGEKDPWGVYVKSSGEKRLPKDYKYFRFIYDYVVRNYPPKKFVNDFICLYKATESEVNLNVLNKLINEISLGYEFNKLFTSKIKDNILMNYLFTVLYLAMVSEYHYVIQPNKKYVNPKLSLYKKKIKFVGIFQTLGFDDRKYSSEESAVWSYSPDKRIKKIKEIKDEFSNIKLTDDNKNHNVYDKYQELKKI